MWIWLLRPNTWKDATLLTRKSGEEMISLSFHLQTQCVFTWPKSQGLHFLIRWPCLSAPVQPVCPDFISFRCKSKLTRIDEGQGAAGHWIWLLFPVNAAALVLLYLAQEAVVWCSYIWTHTYITRGTMAAWIHKPCDKLRRTHTQWTLTVHKHTHYYITINTRRHSDYIHYLNLVPLLHINLPLNQIK